MGKGNQEEKGRRQLWGGNEGRVLLNRGEGDRDQSRGEGEKVDLKAQWRQSHYWIRRKEEGSRVVGELEQ